MKEGEWVGMNLWRRDTESTRAETQAELSEVEGGGRWIMRGRKRASRE